VGASAYFTEWNGGELSTRGHNGAWGQPVGSRRYLCGATFGYRNYPSGSFCERDDNKRREGNSFLREIEAMTKDPVCGMNVDENKTQYQTQYGGKKYNFCSEQCKKEFDKQPEGYARSAA
jgi:YHS domain-containing protein